MRRIIRLALVGASLVAAGCGVGTIQPSTTDRAPGMKAQARALGVEISGNGVVKDRFSTWENMTIKFKAKATDSAAPLAYKWETDGYIWGKKDVAEVTWDGPWRGWYSVTCTVTDGAGNKGSKTVDVNVFSIPTPPPIPHPPIPPHH